MFKENPSYMHFQIGFVQGYVTGYVGEQVLAFKGITKALEALKIGAKVSKSIEDIYSIIQKIGDTLGEKVINILTKSKVIGKNADSIAKWASEAAELGLGRIAKYFDTVEDFDKYLEDVGDLKKFSETVNEVAIKYGDDVAEVLVKSRYGKEALKAGWSIWELNGLNEIIKSGEDILKRIAEKYGQEALQKTASIVGQGSIKWGRNQLTSLAYVVKYSTDYDPELFIQLKKLSNTKGLTRLVEAMPQGGLIDQGLRWNVELGAKLVDEGNIIEFEKYVDIYVNSNDINLNRWIEAKKRTEFLSDKRVFEGYIDGANKQLSEIPDEVRKNGIREVHIDIRVGTSLSKEEIIGVINDFIKNFDILASDILSRHTWWNIREWLDNMGFPGFQTAFCRPIAGFNSIPRDSAIFSWLFQNGYSCLDPEGGELLTAVPRKLSGMLEWWIEQVARAHRIRVIYRSDVLRLIRRPNNPDFLPSSQNVSGNIISNKEVN